MSEYKSQVWRVNVREQILKHEPVSVSQIKHHVENRHADIFPLLRRERLC